MTSYKILIAFWLALVTSPTNFKTHIWKLKFPFNDAKMQIVTIIQ